MHRVEPDRAYPLFDIAGTREIEGLAQQGLPPHALMQRAGESVARLARALAPHARQMWIACGPGNNGGDGLQAAALLQQHGLRVTATLFGGDRHRPLDAMAALHCAQQTGVAFTNGPPAGLTASDLCVDALLGIGVRPDRTLPGWYAQACGWLAGAAAPLLAIDLPSGLLGDTGNFAPTSIAKNLGRSCANPHFHAQNTLCLLTLKPGLFTAAGRDAAGAVWLDTLDARFTGHSASATPCANAVAPVAWLAGPPAVRSRPHASHKGQFGDVLVVGGEGIAARGMGMTGAALLAATAALHAGAGRVLVVLLDGGAISVDPAQPELMLRTPAAMEPASATVVCGCGGGEAVREWLPKILVESHALVLDADALNAVAADAGLQQLLTDRAARNAATVLTPHPLEAARLLGCDTAQVQADRLQAARTLARRFGCVTMLKGSGTVVAAPDRAPHLNPTGNGRLATAGTGDVLAGMVGAALAAGGTGAFDAACAAVFQHGAMADGWPVDTPLTAGRLALMR